MKRALFSMFSIILFVFLGGCTESKPTDSAVSAVVLSKFPECETVKVSDVVIENMVMQTELAYKVRFRYDVRIVPEKLRSYHERMVADNEAYTAIKVKYDSDMSELNSEARRLQLEWSKAENEHFRSPKVSNEEFADYVRTNFGLKIKELEQLRDKLFSDLGKQTQAQNLRFTPPASMAGILVNLLFQECEPPTDFAMKSIAYVINQYPSSQLLEALTSGIEMNLTSTLDMIKSEKGWIEEL